MPEKDLLQDALHMVREHRYADSSRYLADIVSSLTFGGKNRAVDLSSFTLLDERARRLVFDLITARVKDTYHAEVWDEMATKMQNTIKGA